MRDAQKRKTEVLLIQDDPSQAALITKMLSEGAREFSVHHVRHPAEGLSLLQNRTFDVILLDLGPLDSRGLETALAVRNRAKSMPVIVMTLPDDEETALNALQSDIQDYLIKGRITGDVLKRSIRYAMQRKRDREACQRCEQWFASFMLHLPAAAWAKDLNGRYVYANEGDERIFSMPFSEYSGKRDEEFLPPETARQLRENDERVLAEGENLQTIEFLRQADGIEHHYIVNKFPIPGPDGQAAYVAGIALDITERAKAVEALRKSERKFAKIFHGVPALVSISTLEEGRFLDVNDTMLHTLGYRRDEMLGRSALELNFWEDLADRAAMLRALEENGSVRNLEVRLRGKSGQRLVGLFSAEYIELNGNRYLLSLIRDITERKQAEEELRFSEARFRILHDDNPAMIFTLDAEGRILSSNPACSTHLGYTTEELAGQPVLKLFHESERTVMAEHLQTCLQNPDQVYHWQSCKICKNGELVWVEEQSRVIYDMNFTPNVVVVCQDITERKRVEEALQKSERKFAKVFHSVPAFVTITTVTDGRFIDVNDTILQTLGYRREELIGHTSLELNLWEDASDRAAMLRALEEKGSVKNFEARLRGKSGQILVCLFSAEYIDLNGDRYMLSLVKDITEKKRAQEQVERLNAELAARAAELVEANRDLEAFNYTVAHDLRKPLTTINGYCQIIQELCGDGLVEQCRAYLQKAYDGTWRMNQLIDTLLNFSGASRAEPRREAVDLSGIAREVAEELKHAEPDRRGTFLIAEGITVSGDPGLLRVVLVNLLGNAWKYAGIREEAVIEFGEMDIDGQKAWFVRDNGPGFARDDADKLFIPFRRLPGAEKEAGFGIGLATVDRIIRRHGGRIWAEGEPGKGATFYSTLG